MEPAFQSSPGWKCGAEVVQEIDVTNFGTMKFPYGDWLTQTGLKRPETLAVCVILAWTFVRLCAGYAIGASYDEAYYLALARHVSLSYFDHPPMLMWLLAATMKATGSDSIFVLRCALALLFVGTNWLMYRLTTQLFDASAAAFAVFSLNISILFSLGIGG